MAACYRLGNRIKRHAFRGPGRRDRVAEYELRNSRAQLGGLATGCCVECNTEDHQAAEALGRNLDPVDNSKVSSAGAESITAWSLQLPSPAVQTIIRMHVSASNRRAEMVPRAFHDATLSCRDESMFPTARRTVAAPVDVAAPAVAIGGALEDSATYSKSS